MASGCFFRDERPIPKPRLIPDRRFGWICIAWPKEGEYPVLSAGTGTTPLHAYRVWLGVNALTVLGLDL